MSEFLRNLSQKQREKQNKHRPTHKDDDLVTQEDAETHLKRTLGNQLDPTVFSSLTGKQRMSDLNSLNSPDTKQVNSLDNPRLFKSNNTSDDFNSYNTLDSPSLAGSHNTLDDDDSNQAELEKKEQLFKGIHRRKLDSPEERQKNQFSGSSLGRSAYAKSMAAIPKVGIPEEKESDNSTPLFVESPVKPEEKPNETPKATTIKKKIDFDPEPLLPLVSEPLRNRLTATLPYEKLNAKKLETTYALNQIQCNVDEIEENVQDTKQCLMELDQGVRLVSEKSMDLTQTAEAIINKVNVLDDWIDSLDSAGSGLKMQFIEWVVKFLTYLSSLFLLIWHTMRKANPFRKRSIKAKAMEKTDPSEDKSFDEKSESE